MSVDIRTLYSFIFEQYFFKNEIFAALVCNFRTKWGRYSDLIGKRLKII